MDSNLGDKPAPPAVPAHPTAEQHKPVIDPWDFTLNYIAGKFRKDEPGVYFPSMSVESLASKYQNVLGMEESVARDMAIANFSQLQDLGIVDNYHTAGHGFIVDRARLSEVLGLGTEVTPTENEDNNPGPSGEDDTPIAPATSQETAVAPSKHHLSPPTPPEPDWL